MSKTLDESSYLPLENVKEENFPHNLSVSFEKQVIKKDLFDKMSDDAKKVVKIIVEAPFEVVEELSNLEMRGSKSDTKVEAYIFSKRRLRRFLLKRKYSKQRIQDIFDEIGMFVKEMA
jgi:hypothetical protein